MLKRTGTAARKDIESRPAATVLELFVRVYEVWRTNREFVQDLERRVDPR
jgi:GTPase Era involved in 16S rRNA processing